MGSLHGWGGPRNRHAHLWRLSAAEGAPEEIRIRAGQGRGSGKGSSRDRPGGSAALATSSRWCRKGTNAWHYRSRSGLKSAGCLESLSKTQICLERGRFCFARRCQLPQTICLYSSSPKSDICLALSAHGFQTTVEAEPI